MSTIAENLANVRERIELAARAASRDPSAIRLVAVAKTMPARAVQEAYEAGHRDFGENYAQELVGKSVALGRASDIRWHFIGHLQSNKVRAIVPIRSLALLHTVDSVSLVTEIAKQAQKSARKLDVLVEVNTGRELQKHGVNPDDLAPILDAIEAQPALVLRGLMTVPPQDLDETRRAFEEVARLREQHGGTERLPELSMGMSHDLEMAVECGATIVRIGSAIFGPREGKQQ
jgi:pyridoxal phosphate enzyme (YggS family)